MIEAILFGNISVGEKKEQASCICNTSTVRRRKRQIGILLQQQKTNICMMVGWWVWYTSEWNAVFSFRDEWVSE